MLEMINSSFPNLVEMDSSSMWASARVSGDDDFWVKFIDE